MAIKTSNPYLEKFLSLNVTDNSSMERMIKTHIERDNLIQQFTYAIPNAAAINVLVEHSPIVEIGCGAGYWASLVEQSGGDIIAYDKHVTNDGLVRSYALKQYLKPFIKILQGDAEVAKLHSNRTLFLCWPPYKEDMAYHCLKNYLNSGGKTLIYVGEGWSGCTGNDKFHELIDKHMVSCRTIEIPNWQHVHDYMEIWQVKDISSNQIQSIL